MGVGLFESTPSLGCFKGTPTVKLPFLGGNLYFVHISSAMLTLETLMISSALPLRNSHHLSSERASPPSEETCPRLALNV